MLQLAVFRAHRVRCAVPVGCVERVFPMMATAPVPGGPRIVSGLLRLHDQVLPVVNLRRRLSLPDAGQEPGAHLLVLRTPRRRLALATDAVEGVAEVAEGSVAPAAAVLAGKAPIAGVVALPDGILLIQDVEAFLTQDEEDQLDEAMRSLR